MLALTEINKTGNPLETRTVENDKKRGKQWTEHGMRTIWARGDIL